MLDRKDSSPLWKFCTNSGVSDPTLFHTDNTFFYFINCFLSFNFIFFNFAHTIWVSDPTLFHAVDTFIAYCSLMHNTLKQRLLKGCPCCLRTIFPCHLNEKNICVHNVDQDSLTCIVTQCL